MNLFGFILVILPFLIDSGSVSAMTIDVTVPEDCYWLLGGNSIVSHYLGFMEKFRAPTNFKVRVFVAGCNKIESTLNRYDHFLLQQADAQLVTNCRVAASIFTREVLSRYKSLNYKL